MLFYGGEIAFIRSLKFRRRECGTVIACTTAATLESEIGSYNGQKFGSPVQLLIPNIVPARINHTSSRQIGIYVVQCGVVNCCHRPVAISILVCGPIEILVVLSLKDVVCDIRHGSKSGINLAGS